MGRKSTSGVPDRVVVEYRDSTGLHTREFTPETVNPDNEAHDGKTHLDLAKDFCAANERHGAKIVSGGLTSKEKAPSDLDEEPEDKE